MANEEHLKLLRQGVAIWNKKRPNEVDLSGADLRGVNLSEANLIGADLSGANLSIAKLNKAKLSGANLHEANLHEANLYKTDLSGTNLIGANLSIAKLNKANLSRANLSGANFLASQALNTNFESANLTAACIEDWNINKETNLANVICDYIYFKFQKIETITILPCFFWALGKTEEKKMIFTERRPSNPDENFARGDFARLVQKTVETVDLIFRDGIEWKSFAVSLQELNQEAKIKIASESEKDPLSIRAIETRDDGSFVIRVNIPTELDKGEIEKSFKQKYVRALKAREEYYRRELHAKDSQIEIYRQHNADFKEIIAILAKKDQDINIHNNNMPNNNMPNNGDTYNINGPTGIAHNSGEIKGQAKIAGVLNEAQQDNINMIKVEIEQILKPLLEQYPTNTPSEQNIVASQAIQQIENNPSLKARFINGLKGGGLAALEQSLDNPVWAFIINFFEKWQET